MQLRHQRTGQLHDLLVDDIGQRIVAGDLPAGQLIVPQEIGERYGVSGAVVREALRVLGARGLLDARRKAGTRVTDESHWDFLDPKVVAWRLKSAAHGEQLRELLQMRQAIEPLAVRLVAADPDPELIRQLTRAAEDMAGAMAGSDVHRFTEADVTFHTAIFDHCGNRMLGRLSTVITASLQLRETLHLPFIDHTRHGLDMHARLVAEIAAGDKAAETTIRQIVEEFDYEHEVVTEADSQPDRQRT